MLIFQVHILIISMYIIYTFYSASPESVSLIQTLEQSGEVSQKIEIVTAMSMRPQGRISAVWNTKHIEQTLVVDIQIFVWIAWITLR